MNKIYALIAAVVAAFVGLLTIFMSGEKRGKEKEQNKMLKKQSEQAKAIKQLNDNIDSKSTSDIRKKLKDEFSHD
jgi:membrane protein DedA with SNARE-associated domain